MKIGFDLHCVLNINPKEFQSLLKELVQDHHEIIVVSGPQISEVIEELTNLGFHAGTHYHEVLSVVTYLKHEGIEMWQDEKGTWWANDDDWWQSKARICKQNNINVMVDDHHQYGRYFASTSIAADTRFILYSPFLFPRLKEIIYSIRFDKTTHCDYFK